MEIEVTIANDSRHAVKVQIVANAYRRRHHNDDVSFVLGSRRKVERRWSVDFAGGWYDFTVRAAGVERRCAGRMETGRDSVSDPAMGMMLGDGSMALDASTQAQAQVVPSIVSG